MKIFFDVIGCRLNQSEVEGLANTFRALGHQIVGDPKEADLAIINTCAVTTKAAADSRKKLRRAGREGARRVIATGCWATLNPATAYDLPGVTDVIENSRKDSLVEIILDIHPEDISGLRRVREPLPGSRGRTRAFIKVQEGCDNQCTYCLTRIARGKSQSRAPIEIKADIKAALDGGAREIVLTGVQLGAWGRDFQKPAGLNELLSHVLRMDGFDRLRLSSIEPWDLNPEWLAFWQDKRLCRHLHIPLQSGDDRILKAMGRPFDTRRFVDLVHTIRARIPEIAITTDIIAGFPGETETEFNTTIEGVRELAFAGGHVFTFSPRPGTAALKMKDHVPMQIAKQRNAALREVFLETGHAYRSQFIDSQQCVLWESSRKLEDGGWQLSGLTDHYVRVYAISDNDISNQITMVKLTSHHTRRQALIGDMPS